VTTSLRAVGDRLGEETMLAVRAVDEAIDLVRGLESDVAAAMLSKRDASPVTSADLAVQALLAARLDRHWPADALVAEEDATALRRAPDLAARVVAAVHRVDPAMRADDVLASIDRGRGAATGRFWTLDPIDGTKGLLRGGQYAVALARIDAGAVQIAILACPRLALDRPPGPVAVGGTAMGVRGRGAWWLARGGHQLERLSVSRVADPAQARVLHSLEAAHSDAATLQRVVGALGSGQPPRLMDSQVKHVVLAGGEADLLFRFPTSPHRHEAIWDHAAGALIVEEAGGRVTDLRGRPLDFTVGRQLSGNQGLLASNGALHEAALAAVRG
jgi:3'(2'), 5'-bisphosphate nucleotidase